jgi:hypothetical protein
MCLRPVVVLAVLAFSTAGVASADPPPKAQPQAPKEAPGLAKECGVPPGLAKKGGLPPGLAKKFGDELPEEIWIAFDPKRDDGAWFLIDYQWTLMTGFSASLRAEVREARKRPASTPPLPPPSVGVKLHVVQFE